MNPPPTGSGEGPVAPVIGGVGARDGAKSPLWQSPALESLARLTDRLRLLRSGDGIDDVLLAATAALQSGPGEVCLAWHISRDGTRMRRVDRSGGDGGWEPARGPVAQVLGALQPIEMGIVDEELLRVVVGGPLGRIEAGDDERHPNRAFGRFLPLFRATATGPRVRAVLAMLRAAGHPVFDLDERAVLNAAAERLETAFEHHALGDAVRAERNRGFVHGNGVLLSDEMLTRLGAVSGDIVFRHLFEGGTSYVSSGVQASLGFSPEEVLGDPGLIDRLIHPDDRHLISGLVEDPTAADQPLLLRMLRRDGTVSWQLVRVLPITDGRERVLGIEGLTTDVTAMKMAEAELAHQARSDALTGLANRLNFREATGRALARLERHDGMAGVLFLDLDGFKLVNDSHGHAAGDAVLQEVANRLRRVIRREDLVARLGGDEFAVLLAEVRDPSEAAATARRILESLEQPLTIGDVRADISTGIGIAVTRSGAVTPDELINRADIALYQAKRTGRGRWQIHEGLNGSVDTVAAVDDLRAVAPVAPTLSEGSLRVAFAAGEFRVHYLPEIELASGKIVGVEALLRWEHPTLGLLPASAFIAETGDTDVIHPLGDWVLREACRNVADWRAAHSPDLVLWVNVSSNQIERGGFVESMLATIAGAGLSPRAVGMDVSEATIARLEGPREHTLNELHRAGVRLSIDDFGTGTASLKTLRRLPLDQIKIDRTLIEELDRLGSDEGVGADAAPGADPHADDLVPLAIKLAGSLGAAVVAAGVERPEQLRRLRLLQCAYFQGNIAGGTRTADEMAAMLQAGPPAILQTLS